MRQLKMSWNTERGHLVCRWSELKEYEKCERFSSPDRLYLAYNPGNQSTRPVRPLSALSPARFLTDASRER